MSDPLFWVQANRLAEDFPDPSEALDEPDGLLAAGGDLAPERLLTAYRRGIFPWFSSGQPILWWAPDPRSVLLPSQLKISRSLRKTLRRGTFRVTIDRAFGPVIEGCAEPRAGQPGTWITRSMAHAYTTLFQDGYAHSVECWREDVLVGGLYGVAIGRVFFGESMFSRVSDASKVAIAKLAERLIEWDYELIDCQVHNPHLASLGAVTIPRRRFNSLLSELCAAAPAPGAWTAGEDA